MSGAAINRPDADDLISADVDPAGELESANHLLDDHPALEAAYIANGYVLLRGVLDRQVVAEARDAMLRVAADLGMVEPGDPIGRWTGKPLPGSMEESERYAGIAGRLLNHPTSLAILEKVLGEPACLVPLVQYRTYPPHGPATMVHQDGFHSPGIQDYKPVWVPLAPCTRAMGGLAIAVGQNNRGYFHNVGKPSPYPFPRGIIPDDVWATTDYLPGDLLIVHPASPHCTTPNRSDRLRVSFDSRVQSAKNPSAVAATVTAVTPGTVTVRNAQLGEFTLQVDEQTYIRVVSPGVRERLEGFATYTTPGMHLLVVRDGDRAAMLRKAAAG